MEERTVGQRSIPIQDFHEKIAAENKAALESGVKPEAKEESMDLPSSSNRKINQLSQKWIQPNFLRAMTTKPKPDGVLSASFKVVAR